MMTTDVQYSQARASIRNDILLLLTELRAKFEVIYAYDIAYAGECFDLIKDYFGEISSLVNKNQRRIGGEPTSELLERPKKDEEKFAELGSINKIQETPEGANIEPSAVGRIKTLGGVANAIIDILSNAGAAMSISEIADELKSRGFSELSMGAVSVSLHRLGSTGIISRPSRGLYKYSGIIPTEIRNG